MNREVWFRILQVAVVAPWLYHISARTDSDYFRIGLKLVAGSIIVLNAKPLYQDYLNAQKLLSDIRAQMEQETGPKTAVIEGEFTDVEAA